MANSEKQTLLNSQEEIQLSHQAQQNVLAAVNSSRDIARGAFIVYRDQSDACDIHFQQNELDGVAIPEDQLALKDEVENSLLVMRSLFPKGGVRFDSYFRQLLSLAQLGLVGEANPSLALRTLKNLQLQVVIQEGARIKNQYMRKLGMSALTIGLPTFVLALCLRSFTSLDTYSSFCFLWSGCMAGIWLSFGIRKPKLKFEDLHVLESDRLSPYIRLFFAGLLTVVLGLLFSTEAVVISIGSLSTQDLKVSPEIALLIGVLCGVSEKTLSEKVGKTATSLVDIA